VTAKEKESVRRKLVVTAEKLAITAEEKEDIRRKLVVTAKEKESVRRKLAVTAEKLATTAEEKEDIRRKLAVTAKQLAVTAKEKEDTRSKLAVTAKQLAVTAKEKEDTRSKLAVTAKNLAVNAKEIESANKELRSLDLAKDEFVSIASHQLRTPLTALKGYTGMLLDEDAGPINDKQRQYLGEIKNANNRMIALITALLNVSRVDLGVFVVEPEPISLEKVAESVLRELDSNLKYKNLVVKTNFEKDIPLLNVDPQITRMIFQNLLSNALKYTPTGGNISLDIKKNGPTVLISVADTGCGIPKTVQSKIFTKLFRADNARVKDPSGTGLGLYIIKATIEKTGGKIWFKSKENEGSTFYVSIPLEGMKKKEGSKRLE
jgi:signal transduction histidine kinase